MRRTVTIHAGLPKCGSSALQLVLASNRQRLLEAGVYYPALVRPNNRGNSPNHLILANHLVKASREAPDTIEPLLADIVSDFEATGADHLLLSAETFAIRSHLIKPGVLGNLFEDYEVNVIVFFRRRDELLLSAYKQMVLMRSAQLADKFSTFLVTNRSAQVRLAHQFRALQEVFKADHMDVVSLEENKTDVVAITGEILGLPLEQFPVEDTEMNRRMQAQEAAGQPMNKSISDARTVFLAACNEAGLDWRAIGDLQLAFIETETQPGEPDIALLSPSLSSRILQRTEPDRVELERTFGITLGPYAPVPMREGVDYREQLTRAEFDNYVQMVRSLVSPATLRAFKSAKDPVRMVF